MSHNRLARAPSLERLLFAHYLRTGRRKIILASNEADDLGLKFNPNHDPDNGQFTFAPGGPRSGSASSHSGRAVGARLIHAVKPANGVVTSNRSTAIRNIPGQTRLPNGGVSIRLPPPPPLSPSSTPTHPVINPTGGAVRSDSGGDGHFGASRNRKPSPKNPNGKGSHEGVDLLSTPGQSIIAPISGKVRYAKPSADSPFGGVEITSASGNAKVKLFYLKPHPSIIGTHV